MTLIGAKIFHKALNAEQPKPLTYSPKNLGGLNAGPQDLNFDGGVNALEVYAHDLKKWLVELRESGNPSTVDWTSIQNYIQYTAQQLGVDWDPLAELGWSPNRGFDPVSGPQQALPGTEAELYFEAPQAQLTFQGDDQARRIWSNDIAIDVPSMAAELMSVEVTNGNLIPPQQTLKLIVKNKITGKLEAYLIEDYMDATVKIRVPDGVKLNPEVLAAAEKIKPGLIVQETLDAAGDSSSESLGTPAPRKEKDAYVWDSANSVDMSPTMGTEAFKVNTDNLNINIKNRAWKVEVIKTAAHKYVVTITDAAGKSRKIEAEGIDAINIEGADENSVSFADRSSVATAAPKAWDEAHDPDSQLTVNGKGDASAAKTDAPAAGKAVNLKGEDDTAADEIDAAGRSATYNTQSEVALTAQYSDDPNSIQKYEIEDASKVTLNKGTNGDYVSITKQGEDDYLVVFSKKQDGQGAQSFHVKGDQLKNIVIDAPIDRLTYNGEAYIPGLDFKISVKGEAKVPTAVQQLMVATGKSIREITPLLAKHFPDMDVNSDGTLSPEELSQAKFPPSSPNVDLFRFFYDVDKTVQDSTRKVAEALRDDSLSEVETMKDLGLRMVALLKSVYGTDPSRPVDIELIHPNSDDWDWLNDIVMDGKKFDFTTEDNFEGKFDNDPLSVFEFNNR